MRICNIILSVCVGWGSPRTDTVCGADARVCRLLVTRHRVQRAARDTVEVHRAVRLVLLSTPHHGEQLGYKALHNTEYIQRVLIY